MMNAAAKWMGRLGKLLIVLAVVCAAVTIALSTHPEIAAGLMAAEALTSIALAEVTATAMGSSTALATALGPAGLLVVTVCVVTAVCIGIGLLFHHLYELCTFDTYWPKWSNFRWSESKWCDVSGDAQSVTQWHQDAVSAISLAHCADGVGCHRGSQTRGGATRGSATRGGATRADVRR